jgi:triacylglycerol esterase/lipase EstA (alpha/beta hydrolase family)
MGGIMARGYAQQVDYKNQHNFMKVYIHRLITIGTPHFGGQLAGILYSNRENWYSSDREPC